MTGRASFLVGDEGAIAEFKGSYSLTYDFVDHYRGSKATFDRQWEDRWIRDLGFDEFIPKAIGGSSEKMQCKDSPIFPKLFSSAPMIRSAGTWAKS